MLVIPNYFSLKVGTFYYEVGTFFLNIQQFSLEPRTLAISCSR
jgi:hypothetical protein